MSRLFIWVGRTKLRITAIKRPGITWGMDGIQAEGRLCPYCARQMSYGYQHWHQPSTDHVIPRSKGGSNDAENKLAVCKGCNESKANKSLFEFAGWLRAAGDHRFDHVNRLVHYIVEDANFDGELIAEVAVQYAIGAAMHRRQVRKRKSRTEQTSINARPNIHARGPKRFANYTGPIYAKPEDLVVKRAVGA